MEEAHVRHVVAVPQSSERSPRRLFREHGHQEIERVDGRQEGQQMQAPELGGTELPAGTAPGPQGPVFVDELVGNVRIEQREVLGGTGRRQGVHATGRYPFQTVASGFSFSTSDSESFDSAATTCAKTCNTLFYPLSGARSVSAGDLRLR